MEEVRPNPPPRHVAAGTATRVGIAPPVLDDTAWVFGEAEIGRSSVRHRLLRSVTPFLDVTENRTVGGSTPPLPRHQRGPSHPGSASGYALPVLARAGELLAVDLCEERRQLAAELLGEAADRRADALELREVLAEVPERTSVGTALPRPTSCRSRTGAASGSKPRGGLPSPPSAGRTATRRRLRASSCLDLRGGVGQGRHWGAVTGSRTAGSAVTVTPGMVSS